jgi:hypothetical protein
MLSMSNGALSSDAKGQGRESDRSSPPSAKVNNAWSYIATLHMLLLCCLIKHRNKFTVYLHYYYYIYYYAPRYTQFGPYTSLFSFDIAVHMAVSEAPV